MRRTRRLSTSRWLVPGLAAVLALSGSTVAASPSAAPSSVPAGVEADAPLPADIPTATLDVTVGDVVASGEVTPEDGGFISGTDADGRIYSLFVDPGAVMDPVTIEIRPLTGSTEHGEIIAGADFAPAGLQLLVPAAFAVEDVETPTALTSFEYRGGASGADARLVIGPAIDAGIVMFMVSHFSGNVAVDVGSNANQLFDKWSTTRGDDTKAGRQAAAEARYAAADLAERTSHISSETANGIKGRALEEWMSAEGDRLVNDPEFSKMVDSGDPRDLEVLAAEAARIMQVDQQRQAMGDNTQNEGLIKVIEIVTRYEAAMTKQILDSKRVQDMSKSGRVSDLTELMDLFQVMITLQRQIGLLSGGDSPSMAKLVDLLVHIRDGLLASCKKAPLDPSVVLQFARVTALLGNEAFALADVLDCVPDTGPTRPTADVAIDGTLTFDETLSYEGGQPNTWHVVVDAKIRQSGGGLVFASGSNVTVAWTGPSSSEFFDCPTSASWTTGLGSLSGEGWRQLSDPDAGAIGQVWPGAAAELPLSISTGGHYATKDCLVPGTTLACPGRTDRLIGKLVGTTPRDWSFSCSGDSAGRFVSLGGHFVQVR